MKIKNIKFNSPIIAASGTFGYGDEVNDFVNIEKLGAIVTKSITYEPRFGNQSPRIISSASGMLNSIGLANLGVKKFCDTKLEKLNKLNTNIIISVAGSSEEDYINVIKKIEESNGNHIGYEINISCPNVKEDGLAFGVDKEATYKLTIALRKLTNKILIIKLTPNVTSIVDIALSAQEAGADAVSAINTLIGMSIDAQTFKPKLKSVFGGLSGPAIKPVALANIHKLYKTIQIPIIGVGGISCAEDIIEFLLAGSHLIQIGTLNYRSPNLVATISDDLKLYCKKNSIKSISDIIGKLAYHV